MEPETVFGKIENSRGDIVKEMIDLIKIPAVAPENGGTGESARADHLITRLEGFDSVTRIDVPDTFDPSVKRSNILARKNGKKKGTVWIVAHIDTVPAGDLGSWDSPPFEPEERDGKIYGRGTEDNGQAVISAMFASKFFEKGTLNGKSLGIAYVADEETTSDMGITYLLNNGYFSEDDVFIVPDWGSPEGSLIEVAEKSLIWLRFGITGKSTHGSTPEKGINALRVASELIIELDKTMAEKFPRRNSGFMPPASTFEPTKSPATVENVNTVPGYHEFCMDVRLLPEYDLDDVLKAAEETSRRVSEKTKASITVSEIQRHQAGTPSSTESSEYLALKESVKQVTGKEPSPVGVGGATCANFFRVRGYDAYVWETGGGSLHGPNEFVEIDNIITDAKVFAALFYRLCK